VTPEEEARLARARRVNPEAYEAYLKGRFHWYKLTPADLDTALQYFQLTLEKDPSYALAQREVGIGFFWAGRAFKSYFIELERLSHDELDRLA